MSRWIVATVTRNYIGVTAHHNSAHHDLKLLHAHTHTQGLVIRDLSGVTAHHNSARHDLKQIHAHSHIHTHTDNTHKHSQTHTRTRTHKRAASMSMRDRSGVTAHHNSIFEIWHTCVWKKKKLPTRTIGLGLQQTTIQHITTDKPHTKNAQKELSTRRIGQSWYDSTIQQNWPQNKTKK